MLSKIIKFAVLIILVVITFTIFTNAAFAQLVPGAPSTPGGQGDERYEEGKYTLNDILQVGITWFDRVLGMVGAVALLFFIIGGITMILSAGSAEKVEKSKTILKNAVAGLIIVFTAWSIINFVYTALDVENKDKWHQLPGGGQRDSS